MTTAPAILRLQKTIVDLLYDIPGIALFAGAKESIAFTAGDEFEQLSIKCSFVTNSAFSEDAPVMRSTRVQVDFFSTIKNDTLKAAQTLMDYAILNIGNIYSANVIQITDLRDLVLVRSGMVAEPTLAGYYVSTVQFNLTWRDLNPITLDVVVGS